MEELGANPEQLKDYRESMAVPMASNLLSPAIGVGAGTLAALLSRGRVKAANRKLHGRTKFRNLRISIENRKGSYRHWYDTNAGKAGKTKQLYPYGYIRMSEGMDGDHIDCYVGPHEDAKYVYAITTNKAPDFDKEDEQKCMLGFRSATEAKRVFLKHYNDERFFRHMQAIPYEEFERKVLKTLHSAHKKVAYNFDDQDYARLRGSGPGSTHNQVPGDFLGLPHSSLVGMRHIIGDPMDTDDRIDRMFRHMDEPMGARVLEGNSSSLPESPGV